MEMLAFEAFEHRRWNFGWEGVALLSEIQGLYECVSGGLVKQGNNYGNARLGILPRTTKSYRDIR